MIRTLPFVLLLAACGDVVSSPGGAPAGPDTCNSAQFNGLVGQPIGDGGPFLAAGIGYRTIYPGDAVTEDFDPERINVNVDDSGVILSLTCG